jgi:hypothetical protein
MVIAVKNTGECIAFISAAVEIRYGSSAVPLPPLYLACADETKTNSPSTITVVLNMFIVLPPN